MKGQFPYALVFLCIPSVCIAQPTLTSGNFSPVAGDIIINHFCDYLPGATVGSAGAGIIWDLSELTTFSSDTLVFTDCISVPSCASFTETNLVGISRNIDTTYYVSNSAALSMAGTLQPGDTVNFTTHQDLYRYPLTYGTFFTDTSYDVINSVYAMNVHERIHQVTVCDGYGTLVLPTGTFSNVLRLHVQTYFADSNLISGGYITLDSSDNYQWCTPGFHNPLLKAIIISDTVAGFNYATGGSTEEVSSTANVLQTLEIYPNPCYNEMNLDFFVPAAQNVVIQLTDITGNIVAVVANDVYNAGAHYLSYNIANLRGGLYLISMHTDKGTVIKKLQIN